MISVKMQEAINKQIQEELYSSYTALGGNSFITHQMEDIRELKLISAEMEQYDKES